MLYLLTGLANATCPSELGIPGVLTCSSEITDTIVATDLSYLGGECDASECYTCGEPYANEAQIAPEAVYSFTCQQEGDVRLLIKDLPCDLDIYVLDETCDPYTGCLFGSTSPYDANDEVIFTCSPGLTYYIVVEAYGTEHLDLASGPCTDDGTSTGNVFDPEYTLAFDVSASTGCAEDCDDGEDNDLDGDIDCDDSDCLTEALCCDLDEDGYWMEDCAGSDCDDSDPDVYPGAPETADGIDQDCDDTIDEGTDAYDDDGDGFSEDEGDCDDTDPNIFPGAEDIADNGIDEDCDGEDETAPILEDTGDTDARVPGDPSGDAKQGPCGCATPAPMALGWLGLLGLLALRRR